MKTIVLDNNNIKLENLWPEKNMQIKEIKKIETSKNFFFIKKKFFYFNIPKNIGYKSNDKINADLPPCSIGPFNRKYP